VECALSQKEHCGWWHVHFHKRSIVSSGVCTFAKRASWVVACALTQKEHLGGGVCIFAEKAPGWWRVHLYKRSIIGGGMQLGCFLMFHWPDNAAALFHPSIEGISCTCFDFKCMTTHSIK
jgi:hypothetical protein